VRRVATLAEAVSFALSRDSNRPVVVDMASRPARYAAPALPEPLRK
jgi:hypothetical protein